MFLEPSEKTGTYTGVGPHVIGDFYVPADRNSGGTIEFRVGGLTDSGDVISGKFAGWFQRVDGDVDAGGVVAVQPLVAPLGCVAAIDSSGGYVRLVLTGVIGLNASIGVRADALGGP